MEAVHSEQFSAAGSAQPTRYYTLSSYNKFAKCKINNIKVAKCTNEPEIEIHIQ